MINVVSKKKKKKLKRKKYKRDHETINTRETSRGRNYAIITFNRKESSTQKLKKIIKF